MSLEEAARMALTELGVAGVKERFAFAHKEIPQASAAVRREVTLQPGKTDRDLVNAIKAEYQRLMALPKADLDAVMAQARAAAVNLHKAN